MGNDLNERPVNIIGRKLACENTKLRVFFDHIVGASGSVVERFMVVSLPGEDGDSVELPLQHETGITVLPVSGSNVGLLRVFRHPVSEWIWEAPRGFIDEGETATHAALRELTEETGLIGTEQSIVDLGYLLPEPGLVRGRGHLFAVTDCKEGGQSETELEIGIGQFQWFSLSRAVEMVISSEIQESHTSVSILRYSHFVKNKVIE